MDSLTIALEKSIAYEQSKKDVMNLNNHKRQDLDVPIEVFEAEIKATKHMIASNQYYIDSAEDMEEGLVIRLQKTIQAQKAKLETLLAWRALFLSAWFTVKQ
jgi:hypothetical protein